MPAGLIVDTYDVIAMKKLTGSDVVRVMREEYERKLRVLAEDVNLSFQADVDGDKDKETILSPELKIKHKESGLRYTVSSVSPRDVVLRTPEGKEFVVVGSELDSYELA